MAKTTRQPSKSGLVLGMLTLVVFLLAILVIIRGPIGEGGGWGAHRLISHAEPPRLLVAYLNENLGLMASLEIDPRKDLSGLVPGQAMNSQEVLAGSAMPLSSPTQPSLNLWGIWPSVYLPVTDSADDLTEEEIILYRSLKTATANMDLRLEDWESLFASHALTATGTRIGNEVGNILRSVERYGQAEQWYRRILPSATEGVVQNSVQINLALVCLEQQKLDEAKKLLEAVRGATVEARDEYSEGFRCVATGLMGFVLVSESRQEEAISLLDEEIAHTESLMRNDLNKAWPGLYAAMEYSWKLKLLQRYGSFENGMALRNDLINRIPLNRWTAKSHEYCRALLKQWLGDVTAMATPTEGSDQDAQEF